MQAELSTTESHGQAKTKDFIQVVTFKLGREEYSIEITKVKEIILVEGITRVPQMPDFIEGIINLRGNVIPVIDLRKRFGLPHVENDEHSRIMVTKMDAKIIGLIVDSVSQVMKIGRGQIQNPPDTIAGLAGDYLTGIGKVDGRMILMLDVEKILCVEEETSLADHGQEKRIDPTVSVVDSVEECSRSVHA